MKEDLELILEYIKILKTETTGIIKSALSYSLISLYGKCFTDATKKSNPKLELKELFAEEDENFKIHNLLMELRHEFIAHRGETDSEIGIAYMLVPKKDNIEQSQIRFSQLKEISFSEEDLNGIQSLTHFLIEILIKKIEKHGQKVYEGLLSIFSAEQLSQMILNNAK